MTNKIICAIIVLLGLYMVFGFTPEGGFALTPPVVSGIALILIGVHCYLGSQCHCSNCVSKTSGGGDSDPIGPTPQ